MQIAIQGCVDIASHIVSDNSWDLPGNLAGLFDVFSDKKAITPQTRDIMRAMVGFRNLIAQEYATLDMRRVYELYTSRLNDFNTYLKEINSTLLKII